MPPTFLIDSLNDLRRKVKLYSLAFGIGVVLAAAVALLLAAVCADFLLSYLLGVNLPAGMRLLVLLALCGAVVFATVRYLLRPVLARLTLGDIAGHVESVFPEFDDRLRSTVDFVQQPADSIPGSAFMKERVVTEATTIAQKTDLSRALVTRPVWYSVSSAAAALVLLIAVSLLLPAFVKIGLPRLFAPFAPNAWPKRVEIDAAALPTRVPVGQRIDVSMLLKKGDKPSQKAFIYYQYDNGPVQKEYMIRGDAGKYTASLDARGDNLKVWMAAGDDETKHQVIEVVPRLAIARVEAVVAPPAYSQMPPLTTNLGNTPAFMTVGSTVTLSVSFNKDLDDNRPVTLNVLQNESAPSTQPAAKPPSPTPDLKWSRPSPNVAVATWTATDSFRFRLTGTDRDGFANTGLEEYEVVVKPDQLPTVMIESPRRNVERTPDAYLPLQVLAEDDFGVSTLRLIVDKIGSRDPSKDPKDAKKHWELDLKNWQKIDGTGERQRFRLNWDWELKQTLGALKPGDVLEYFVEVRDNYRLESPTSSANAVTHPPQLSSKLRISVISEEEAIVANTDAIRILAQKTKAVRDAELSNQNETKNLQQDTKDKPELSKGDKAALEGLTSRQSAIVSQTKSLAGQLDDVKKDLEQNRVKDQTLNDIAKEAKDTLDQAAEKPMTDAAQQLNQAQQSKANPANPQQTEQQKQQRNQALEKSEQNQADAAARLSRAMEKMDQVGNLPGMIKEVQDILNKQQELSKQTKDIGREELGKKPEQMKPENREKLDKVAKEQKDLAERTDKAVQQMEKMKDQMKKSDPQAAEAMEQAAQQAKSQQVSPQQRNASQQAQQNQQAQAQNSQKQAEIGLQVVLNTLKDAERRKLEQLAKMFDDAIKAISDLVRRQAGHNIDNLDNQGGDAKAKAMTKEELDVLYAKAKRDQKNPAPRPELAVVTSGQEATERNTRSLARDIEEKIPEGGVIASDLVRAAGKMGYAIVDLRDKKLSSAYNPHQVEALNALEQALKKAEDKKKEIDQKKEDQQKDAIRAQFEKIRADQLEQVNKPTTDIHKTRKPDGTLARQDTVRLNQLPGAQAGIAKRVGDLTEDLQALGGIIYVWATKDIVNSMNDVKEDLTRQKTGKLTQLEEARIIEQLDAMIDSLKTEKDQDRFVQKQGGGGGNGTGGGSKLPTEAELRLLKRLQQAINRNTTEADKLPKAQQDKSALVGLGTRQGELRGLLDQLLKAATQGKEGLKPEPDPKDKLPEEAGKEAIENQEVQDELLGGDAKAKAETKQLNRVGDRMARSRQRLALDQDPGKITQEIQKRIIVDIDDMIKQAQQNQQQAQSQPKPGQPKPNPGEQQPGQQEANQSQPNQSANPAQQSTVSGGGSRNADTSAKINETATEWGKLSPRLRDAVIEGATEQIPQKYQKLIEDYYRGVSTGGKQP